MIHICINTRIVKSNSFVSSAIIDDVPLIHIGNGSTLKESVTSLLNQLESNLLSTAEDIEHFVQKWES